MAVALEHTKSVPLESTPEQGHLLAESLLADGLIERLPARYQEGYAPANGSDHHPPITVIGRPVSETLLEDRDPYDGTPYLRGKLPLPSRAWAFS